MQKHKKIIILEEIFNSITHGTGAILSIFGLVLLIMFTRENSLVKNISVIIFGASLTLMYLMSTLFHSLFFTKAKNLFHIFDRSSIFLLIAGTYTPVILVVLHGWISIVLLLLIWSLAIVGIVFNSIFSDRIKILYVPLYLLMGWIGIFTLHTLLSVLSLQLIMLLVGGGLLYTTGIIFYSWKKLPFNHTIWHLFVLSGSLCHFLFVTNL